MGVQSSVGVNVCEGGSVSNSISTSESKLDSTRSFGDPPRGDGHIIVAIQEICLNQNDTLANITGLQSRLLYCAPVVLYPCRKQNKNQDRGRPKTPV